MATCELERRKHKRKYKKKERGEQHLGLCRPSPVPLWMSSLLKANKPLKQRTYSVKSPMLFKRDMLHLYIEIIYTDRKCPRTIFIYELTKERGCASEWILWGETSV